MADLRGDLVADVGQRGVWIGGLQLDGFTPGVGMTLVTHQAPGDSGVGEGAPGPTGHWRVVAVAASVDASRGPRLRVVVVPLNPEGSWAIERAQAIEKETLESAGG